jgi:acyl carrier protein
MTTQEDVISIIANALNVKSGDITTASSSSNIENWDSLGHLSVLIALDKMFAGKVAEIGEMAEADAVEKIITLLKSNSLI